MIVNVETIRAKQIGIPGRPGVDGSTPTNYTEEPTGFVNLTSSSLSYNNTTRTISINISGGNSDYKVFVRGGVRTISNAKSISLPNLSGWYFIYLDGNLDILYSSNSPELDQNILLCLVYWNDIASDFTWISDERYTILIGNTLRKYLNYVVGYHYKSGCNISYSIGTGETDDEILTTLSPGVFLNEDSEVSTSTKNSYKIVYGDLWNPQNSAYPVYSSGGIHYDNSGTLTLVPDNNYCVYWIVATNDQIQSIYSVAGTQVSDDLEETLSLNNNINLTPFKSDELKVLYKLVYQVNSSYNNTLKCRLVQVEDYRNVPDTLIFNVSNISEYAEVSFIPTKYIDDDNDPILYIGEAKPGSDPADAVWRIKKINLEIDDAITWAEGTSQYANTWNDRLTYTYS